MLLCGCCPGFGNTAMDSDKCNAAMLGPYMSAHAAACRAGTLYASEGEGCTCHPGDKVRDFSSPQACTLAGSADPILIRDADLGFNMPATGMGALGRAVAGADLLLRALAAPLQDLVLAPDQGAPLAYLGSNLAPSCVHHHSLLPPLMRMQRRLACKVPIKGCHASHAALSTLRCTHAC